MNHEIQKIVQNIFNEGYFLSLATIDDGGVWVSDLFYVADDDWNVYWLSARDTRHSKAIDRNPKVAGTITITTTPQEPSEALQISGYVEVVKGELNEEVEALFLQKRGKQKKAESTRVSEQSWYKLTPTKIRLSHEEVFGLEKQDVELKKF